MSNIRTKLFNDLNAIKNKAYDAIKDILDEKLTENDINLYYYSFNGDNSCFSFLDTNVDGYGTAIFIEGIKRLENGEYEFVMVDDDDEYWGVRELADFKAEEAVWVLDMLEDTFNAIDENYGGKILPIGVFDYDEYETEEN